MKRFIITLMGVSVAWSASLVAAGLPIEDGKIVSPHTLLTLSDSQLEELEALDSVTLTKAQWAQLRKVSPSAKKRITPILPETYNDCSCGMLGGGGILMKNGQLAVLHSERSTSSLSYQIGASSKLTLQVDRRGQFHFDGELIRYETLLQAIDASTPFDPADDSHRARIQVPPLMSPSDKVFDDRIVRVKTALEEKGWKFFP